MLAFSPSVKHICCLTFILVGVLFWLTNQAIGGLRTDLSATKEEIKTLREKKNKIAESNYAPPMTFMSSKPPPMPPVQRPPMYNRIPMSAPRPALAVIPDPPVVAQAPVVAEQLPVVVEQPPVVPCAPPATEDTPPPAQLRRKTRATRSKVKIEQIEEEPLKCEDLA